MPLVVAGVARLEEHLEIGEVVYTVARCTPARSAMALMVVFAGPSVWCSSTVASTIRCLVSASVSARFVFRYGRGDAMFAEHIC